MGAAASVSIEKDALTEEEAKAVVGEGNWDAAKFEEKKNEEGLVSKADLEAAIAAASAAGAEVDKKVGATASAGLNVDSWQKPMLDLWKAVGLDAAAADDLAVAFEPGQSPVIPSVVPVGAAASTVFGALAKAMVGRRV